MVRSFSTEPDKAPVGTGTVLAPKATGGRLPGFSSGGKLPSTGPGTEVADGFLGIDSLGIPRARLDAREWIINGDSSDRYNRELAAINAGTFPKLPGFATGGMYSAQQFGRGPTVAASGPMQMTGTLVMDSGEVLGVFHGVAVAAAQGVVSAADSNSQFIRKGR